MTPVVRPTNRTTSSGPAWLNGTTSDPNIRPAGGVGLYRPGTILQVAGSSRPKEEPSVLAKGFDKLKGAFSNGSKTDRSDRSPEKMPAGVAAVTPTANTAFRGTTATGAPVYAGPPAYRWYGWGSVTPGANPYAQTGQYPPASANWYSITGAMPGAFPVPVTNPLPAGTGTEPPALRRRTQSANRTRHQHLYSGAAGPALVSLRCRNESAASAGRSRQVSEPPAEPRTTPTPTISVLPEVPVNPAPVSTPMVTQAEPPIRPVMSLPPLPEQPEVRRAETIPALPTTRPEPLPVSVTEETSNWQRKSETVAPGDWGPAGAKPAPAKAPAEIKTPDWQQPGMSFRGSQPIARGQIDDTRPDPVVELIRRLCNGRAERVEASWTTSKRLTVKFVGPTASDVRRLADEISASTRIRGHSDRLPTAHQIIGGEDDSLHHQLGEAPLGLSPFWYTSGIAFPVVSI